MIDRSAVSAAVRAVLAEVGSPKRVGLVVPDSAAKVSMVKFETVPARAEDLAQMVRWQVRKAVPFPIEHAQVAYAPGSAANGPGREFVVVVLKAVFRMNESHAYRVMMTAHQKGACVIAVYTRDVADTKAKEATEMGRAKGYPLYFTTEKEE